MPAPSAGLAIARNVPRSAQDGSSFVVGTRRAQSVPQRFAVTRSRPAFGSRGGICPPLSRPGRATFTICRGMSAVARGVRTRPVRCAGSGLRGGKVARLCSGGRMRSDCYSKEVPHVPGNRLGTRRCARGRRVRGVVLVAFGRFDADCRTRASCPSCSSRRRRPISPPAATRRTSRGQSSSTRSGR